jgi:cytochrome c-type biogenesis protein CcmF
VAAAFGLSLAAMLVLLAVTRGGPVSAPLGIGLGLFLILGSASEIATRSYARSQPASVSLRRALGLPRSAWGSAIAHAGLGVTVIGLAASAWSGETIATARPGQALSVGPYMVRLVALAPRSGPNYSEQVASLAVTHDGSPVGPIESTKRLFASRQSTTTEAGILTIGFSQVYASFGESYADGSIGLRLYYKPLVLLIWLGAVVMAAGGALSLTDRRFRVGAPVRARGAMMPAPAE